MLCKQLIPFLLYPLFISLDSASAKPIRKRPNRLAQAQAVWNGPSTLVAQGTTGVSAMQLTVVGNHHVLIIDKAENNPLTINNNPAWVSYMDVNSLDVTPIPALTNTFCASGAWLGNGTLISVGGNPAVGYGDQNGFQAIRLFNGKDNGMNLYENPNRIRLSTNRWYAGTARLPDGSVFIMGGMTSTGFNNAPWSDNPTIEYFPSKNIRNSQGMPIASKFLKNALNSNLFPIIWLLPDGTLFVAADTIAMKYNWQKNTEQRLPSIPNKVILTYPWSAAAALLPLRPANNYLPEVLFCGGSKAKQNPNMPGSKVSTQDPTSSQCIRMALNAAGIKAGWKIEKMPVPRIMSVAVVLPTGDVLITGGAQTGSAGYDDARNKVGHSNADNPALTPVLYQPSLPAGSRFNTNFPTSNIARMYHSSATLLPDGRIMSAGSNPNNDYSTEKYPTEYRSEFLSPPYMTNPNRPSFSKAPAKIPYKKTFSLSVNVPSKATTFSASLMDYGYSTHGLNYNQRFLELVCKLSADRQTLTVTGPPNANLFPPGPAFLSIIADGIPSAAQMVMLGPGRSPPVDMKSTNNMLRRTRNPQ